MDFVQKHLSKEERKKVEEWLKSDNELLSIEDREQIRGLVLEALSIDGAHHKQWYLEEIAKIVIKGIKLDTLDYEKGIAP